MILIIMLVTWRAELNQASQEEGGRGGTYIGYELKRFQ